VLEGVITQQLIPHISGKGRVLVAEVMICTPAIRATIRDDKIHQIYGLMQAGQKYGMQTMNQGLFSAFVNRKISLDEAMRRSSDPVELEQMLGECAGSGGVSYTRK
jgi:twitching motility protein PilT